MARIVILGPPGSGKGTQAVRIASELGIKHLSTGDILRNAVARKTDLGVQAEDYMRRGLLVPDDIMLGMIREEIDALGDSGWILDGFPRTLNQAEALSEMLEERGLELDRVVLLEVDSEIIVARLTSRLVCAECGAVYNLNSLDAAETQTCSRCGGDLVKRPDDEEETVHRRIRVYEEQTAPVVDFFEKRDGLVTIDGAIDIDEITTEILRDLK